MDVVGDEGANPSTSIGKEMKTCKECNKEFPKDLDHFYGSGFTKLGNQKFKSRCKKCYESVQKSRFEERIARFYGKYECQVCGYNKCRAAIEFHHIEESKKDFEISKMRHYSEASLFAELEKCMIVCANCHREIHHGGELDSIHNMK